MIRYRCEKDEPKNFGEEKIREIQALSGILFRLLDGHYKQLESDDINLEGVWMALRDMYDEDYEVIKEE